ncbi:MAG TPA: pilus assembly protein TadG-related protein [Candidatus Dormibacteraeota bacterium]|nr:pilus assembly protein TadG-related protein [Candidatus Dormibacteraeota bacterium]
MRAQKGQAIVLIAIMLAVVVGMAALAIDGARAYSLRRDLQAAVDSAALAAGDRMQQTGSYTGAEQAASTIFGINLRLYGAPSCSPGYGSPGASSYTASCTYSDGSTLTDVVTAAGPQGSMFQLTATRTLQLQFARILTTGANPIVSVASSAETNNQRYTPAVSALGSAGCGGVGGSTVTINGSGTLNVTGDIVANGAVTVGAGSVRVAGDLDARCQAPVPGSVSNACYPSGASTPCSYPDVAGATRSGFRLVDPGFPAASPLGGSQGAPGNNVVLQAGTYAANPNFNSGDCWFLGGGVYTWQAGYTNNSDLVSNELKPPAEPVAGSITSVSTHQFWNTNGVNCAGSLQVDNVDGPNALDKGNWGVVLTSVRTDTYAGTSYKRESAPSACQSVHVHNGEVLQVQVSNVPGATSYNVYASSFGNGCNGPLGFVGSIPVVGTVSNSNTNPCPAFNGSGCSLGHETATFDNTLLPDSFAPNSGAAADTYEAYPPDPEIAPLNASLPNQNPTRGANAAGDRANENNCESATGMFASCPTAVTPGAVEFYLPGTSCLTSSNGANTYVFSGYQYDWISVNAPGGGCTETLGAASNSAYVGLVYAPLSTVSVASAYGFEVAACGGVMAATVNFTGTLPAITYGSDYAPVPPASRLIG